MVFTEKWYETHIHPRGMLGKVGYWNGKHHSEQTKLKWKKRHITPPEVTSKRFKTLWSQPEFRERTIRVQLKGLFKRPTSLERQFIEFIQKYNLPFKYVGDGSFLIGWKNPDFININGEKICVEVANHFHHQGNYVENRIEHFKKWGWNCIVIFANQLNAEKGIWEFELPDNEILKKLNEVQL